MSETQNLPAVAQNNAIQAFTFGDPEPVMNTHDYMSMFQVYWNGTYYEPPVSLRAWQSLSVLRLICRPLLFINAISWFLHLSRIS
jgi:hypothetical protein